LPPIPFEGMEDGYGNMASKEDEAEAILRQSVLWAARSTRAEFVRMAGGPPRHLVMGKREHERLLEELRELSDDLRRILDVEGLRVEGLMGMDIRVDPALVGIRVE